MDRSMGRSLSSGNGSNTNSGGSSLGVRDVHCFCGKSSLVRKSWTDENPGRKFLSCGEKWSSCNFFRWFDVERPYGWQKRSLLEARDIIRDQSEELKKLRAMVSEINGEENVAVKPRVDENEVTSEMEIDNKKREHEVCIEIENKKMKQEIDAFTAKEKLLRQFVIISWVGFVCVIAVVVNALK